MMLIKRRSSIKRSKTTTTLRASMPRRRAPRRSPNRPLMSTPKSSSSRPTRPVAS